MKTLFAQHLLVLALTTVAITSNVAAEVEGALVYVGFDGTSWDVWRAQGDTASRITRQRDATSPTVAGDGRIAFADASGTIWIQDRDGNTQAITDVPKPCDHPAWSPDGRRLAFACFRFDNRQDDGALWMIDLESNEAASLYDGPGLQKSPAWSPDGLTLAFVTGFRLTPTRVLEHIWTIDARGEQATAIIEWDGSAIQPAWSPDGKKIAFASDTSGNLEIWVMHLATDQATRLTDHPAYDSDPTWSPSGREIAFVSTRGGELEIWAMPAKGGRARRWVEAKPDRALSAKAPDWSRGSTP